MSEIVIKAGADTAAARREIDRLGKELGGGLAREAEKAQSSFGRLGASLKANWLQFTAVGAAVGGVAAFFAKATSAAYEEAAGIRVLDTALKNAGGSYASMGGEIERVIAAQQRKTNFGDGEQRESLTRLVTMTGEYSAALRALPVAMDLAASTGMSLEAASLAIGKALEGNVDALTRYGIKLQEGATGSEALAELTARFGGSAAAAVNPMTQLGNAVGDLVEELGGLMAPAVTPIVEGIAALAKGLGEVAAGAKDAAKEIGLLANPAARVLSTQLLTVNERLARQQALLSAMPLASPQNVSPTADLLFQRIGAPLPGGNDGQALDADGFLLGAGVQAAREAAIKAAEDAAATAKAQRAAEGEQWRRFFEENADLRAADLARQAADAEQGAETQKTTIKSVGEQWADYFRELAQLRAADLAKSLASAEEEKAKMAWLNAPLSLGDQAINTPGGKKRFDELRGMLTSQGVDQATANQIAQDSVAAWARDQLAAAAAKLGDFGLSILRQFEAGGLGLAEALRLLTNDVVAAGAAIAEAGAAVRYNVTPDGSDQKYFRYNALTNTVSTNDASLIPRRANGGLTPGGPVLVGERGPEILSPPAGSMVSPNGELRALLVGIRELVGMLKQGGQQTSVMMDSTHVGTALAANAALLEQMGVR